MTKTNTRFSHKEAGRPTGQTLSSISYGLTRRIGDLETVTLWLCGILKCLLNYK